MLPLTSEELSGLKFCLEFLFCLVEGAMRGFFVSFYQFFMRFVCWCLVRSTEMSDSINFCLGSEKDVLGVIADGFSEGSDGECDSAGLGGTVLCSGCLLSVLCPLNSTSSLCEFRQPWGCQGWDRRLQNNKQLASLVVFTL